MEGHIGERCVHRASRGRRGRDTRGSALVLALVVVALVAAMGGAFLRLTTHVSSRQAGELETLKAFYLAEAGLAEAFHAVRIGRTGQVGSETEPAVYGEGILWVDATETGDDQVRLECTAMTRTGRASLALIVEPVEIPLGFFSDEDLVIDSVLLVDGFNSEEETYAEASGSAAIDEALQAYADSVMAVIGAHLFAKLVMNPTLLDGDQIEDETALDDDAADALAARLPTLRDAFAAGTIHVPGFVSPRVDGHGGGESNGDSSSGGSAPSAISPDHTDDGGLLGSNGSVIFVTPEGEPVEVWGDVVPGPDGTVQGVDDDDVVVTGNTDSRSKPVELPEVEVPSVTFAAPVRHDGVLPMVVSSGTSGHERIEIASGAELILRGPCTVVIGELILEPGALLELDTRGGDVELYVTQGMDLQTGSDVATTSEKPDEVSVQVAPIPTGPDGAPVKLDATAQFHGTVYAPESDVKIGSDFEIYGGVVAKKLEIGAGAKLHFDSAEYDGSPIPRIIGWRIVDVPAAATSLLGNPLACASLDRDDLEQPCDAHDLANVWLAVDYETHAGAPETYEGYEDGFDWDRVGKVLSIQRKPERAKEGVDEDANEDPTDGGDGSSTPEDPTAPVDGRPEVMEAIATLTDKDLRDALQPKTPLSDAELIPLLDDPLLSAQDTEKMLRWSLPLSEDVLLHMINSTNHMESIGIRDVLQASSPLSQAVIDALDAAPDSKITPAHKEKVMNRN